MRIPYRTLTFCGLMMIVEFSAIVPAMGGTQAVVGRVINSSNATIEGDKLLSNSTIFSGDAVTVGKGGSVLLSFSPTGRAVLAPATQVRFSGSRGNFVAQLLSGSVAVGKQEKDDVVVRTSSYEIRPKGVGRAEFVVALLPNRRPTVETQRGKVVITDSRTGERNTVAEGLLAEISPAATEPPGQPGQQAKVVGNIVTSAGGTDNGKPLVKGVWINDGDAVSTEGAGRTRIQLLPTNQVTLDENTQVNFTMPYDRTTLELLGGTIVVENKGDRNVLIATTRFRLEPGSAGASSIFVSIKPDMSTYIDALNGDVRIRDTQTDQTYVLPSGQHLLIPADASGIPGLEALPKAGAPPTTPEPPPITKPAAAGVRGHPHTTIIILGAAAGGGIAAIIAATHSGGSSGGPVVPPTSSVVP